MAKFSLPSNVDAERSVLGAMLLDGNAAATGLAVLSEESFSDVEPRNRCVFRAMFELGKKKTPIDTTTVLSELQSLKIEKDAGGVDYLFNLVQSNISYDNIDHYIKIVKDAAVLRDYLTGLQQIQNDYVEGGLSDVGDFIATAQQELTNIANNRSVGDFRSASDVAKIVGKQIDLESANGNNRKITGVDTGYRRLNQITHGWQKDDFVIIAARPSVGKTAFALNLAYNACRYTKKSVAFFSLEMSAAQLMKRLLASVAWVNGENIQTGALSPKDKLKISEALGEISQMKLFFDDTPNAKLGDIVARSRKLKSANPDLCLIVIDYLSLIELENKTNSRTEDVSQVSRSIKELARTLHVPVIALSQLNRNVEQNEGNKPKLSNLRESGSIEQDADMVLLMYRNDYYDSIGLKKESEKGMSHSQFTRDLQNSVKAQQSSESGEKKDNGVSVVEISVAKNRNGKIGEVTLMFSKDYVKFDDPTPEFEAQASSIKNGFGRPGAPLSPGE